MDLPISALPRILFVGGGNMAQALIGGLRARGLDRARLHAIEPDARARARLSELGVDSSPTADAHVGAAAVVVLAVKPQSARAACLAIAPHLAADVLVVSVAAGVRIADLSRWAGRARVVRTMPNTPALVGAGMTGLAAAPAVDAAGRAVAQTLLGAVGDTLWVEDESMLDAVTAVSGSGPAYVFRFIEALQAGAERLGFGSADARRLAVLTFAGASRLAAESDDAPSTLRERVTSKGGTTFAALAAMDAAGVPDGIVAGVMAAAVRSRELGEQAGRDPDA